MAHDIVEKSVSEFSGELGWSLPTDGAAEWRRGVAAGPYLAHGWRTARKDQDHRPQGDQPRLPAQAGRGVARRRRQRHHLQDRVSDRGTHHGRRPEGHRWRLPLQRSGADEGVRRGRSEAGQPGQEPVRRGISRRGPVRAAGPRRMGGRGHRHVGHHRQGQRASALQNPGHDTKPVTHIRMYASGGEFTWQKGSRFVGPDDLVKQALRHKAAGYTAFKYRPGGGFGRLGIKIADYIPYMRDLRGAVGSNFDLIQEANTRWSMEQCMEIAPVLEELKYLWFEEPTRKNIDDYVKLKRYLPTVRISGGETMPNRATLAEWVDRGAYDIVQPGCDDAGVTECWHMARMAGSRGKLICPHNWQDGLITAANAHLLAAVPNRFLLESNMTPNPFKEGLFKEKFQAVDGYIEVPQKPGLGVELKEGLEELYPPIPGNWNMPDPNFPR